MCLHSPTIYILFCWFLTTENQANLSKIRLISGLVHTEPVLLALQTLVSGTELFSVPWGASNGILKALGAETFPLFLPSFPWFLSLWGFASNSQLISCESHPIKSFFSSYFRRALCHLTSPPVQYSHQKITWISKTLWCLNSQFFPHSDLLGRVPIRVRVAEFLPHFPVLHFVQQWREKRRRELIPAIILYSVWQIPQFQVQGD